MTRPGRFPSIKSKGGNGLRQKRNSPIRRSPGGNPPALRRTAAGLKGLLGLARKRPRRIWGTFRRWYAGSDDMPSWAIDRFDGEEVHIHLGDFAIGAIVESLRERCRHKGWTLAARTCKGPLVERHLFISKEGTPLLRMHNTSCSTPGDSYICVHLRPEDAPLNTLVDLFRYHILSEDVAYYRKIFKAAPRRRPSGI